MKDYIPNRELEELGNGLVSSFIKWSGMEVLKGIRSGSVNLIFADAPYNIGKDFGNNSDKWESVSAYVDWCKSWIDECIRVLADDGTILSKLPKPGLLRSQRLRSTSSITPRPEAPMKNIGKPDTASSSLRLTGKRSRFIRLPSRPLTTWA